MSTLVDAMQHRETYERSRENESLYIRSSHEQWFEMTPLAWMDEHRTTQLVSGSDPHSRSALGLAPVLIYSNQNCVKRRKESLFLVGRSRYCCILWQKRHVLRIHTLRKVCV